MYIKQISIFIENQPGMLAEVTEKLSALDIDIRALSLADTTSFGILRLIVDDPFKAEAALKQQGYSVSLTPVIAIRVDDRPGGLAQALKALHSGGISIEYMYAFISRKADMASIIMRVDDGDKAVDILERSSIPFLSDKDMGDM